MVARFPGMTDRMLPRRPTDPGAAPGGSLADLPPVPGEGNLPPEGDPGPVPGLEEGAGSDQTLQELVLALLQIPEVRRAILAALDPGEPMGAPSPVSEPGDSFLDLLGSRRTGPRR